MPRNRTYFERWLRTVGFRKTQRVMAFMAQWAIFWHEEGRPPVSIDEYAQWWEESRATAFREQQAWREAMPEYSTPTEFFEALGVDPVEDPGRATGAAMQEATA